MTVSEFQYKKKFYRVLICGKARSANPLIRFILLIKHPFFIWKTISLSFFVYDFKSLFQMMSTGIYGSFYFLCNFSSLQVIVNRASFLGRYTLDNGLPRYFYLSGSIFSTKKIVQVTLLFSFLSVSISDCIEETFPRQQYFSLSIYLEVVPF